MRGVPRAREVVVECEEVNKTKSQRLHAKRRALERYGISLNRKRYREIVADIQAGRGEFIERRSHRISVWKVKIAGELVRVVYDKIRKTIVTVLPREDP